MGYIRNGTYVEENPDGSYFIESPTGQSKSIGLIQDSGQDAISKLANDLNLKLDASTKDYLMQHYLNEQSNKSAWERQMTASNTQYQRAVKDLQAAGLNPFLAIQSLSGSSPTSSGQSVQGGLFTSREASKRQQTGQILGILAIIAAAVIRAML